MGGLRKLIPHTFRTMFVATLAIAGVPFLAGFFSKDAILGETWGAGYPVLWALAALTAGLTAFYMFRLIKMTFYGDVPRDAESWEHVHESPATMTVPLYVLAAGAVVVGWLGIPKFLSREREPFEAFLEPSFPALPAGWTPQPHEMSHSTEWTLMLASIAIAGPRHPPRAASSTPARPRSRCRRGSSRLPDGLPLGARTSTSSTRSTRPSS